jgi:hypothetical protein
MDAMIESRFRVSELEPDGAFARGGWSWRFARLIRGVTAPAHYLF